MNEMQLSHPALRRRGFLKLLGVLGAIGTTAALGQVLFTLAPWLNYDEQVERTWDKLFEKEATIPTQMRELIHYATLAANGHNTQPWKFTIKENAIQIQPDYSRRLAVVDPNDREMWISLGCALENLVIAAQATGYTSEVVYPSAEADYIDVQLRQTSTASSNSLFDAIPDRQCTRSAYDGQPVPSADLQRIESAPLETGVSIQVFTAANQIESILEYIKAGNLHQYGDQAFINELVSWIRFNKGEVFETLDGLYTRCLGNPDIPRWLGKMFVTTSSAKQLAQTDEIHVRSSSGVLVIVSEKDDKQAWLDTGRVYERLALTLTTLNIKSAFLNQPIEVTELRPELQSYLNLGTALPQLLLRFGYTPPMPRSLRRPVEQVLV